MTDHERLFGAYRRDGYAVVRRLLDREAVEDVLRETDAIFALQLRRLGYSAIRYQGEATVLANMETLLAADVKTYLAAARHAAKLVSLQRLVSSQPIVDLVRSFGISTPTVPTTPVLHIMGDTLRIPGGYFGIAPHQDWPSVQGGLDTVTMWVPLMDIDVKRFPVEVIPGSHMRGLWEGEITEHAMEIRKGFVDSDFVPLAAARGDVVVFTGFTVHRTSLLGCRGLRIASSTRYENAGEATFVERNYPCAYQRSVERRLIHPGFPAPDQVAAIYR
jgi:ectoine hydroxylase-related dioxygenase (phytanoyl-CoA dioxygenase family)